MKSPSKGAFFLYSYRFIYVKKIFLYLSLSLIYIPILGINNDSLFSVWNNSSENDTNRLKAIQMLISQKYMLTNPDSTILLANNMYDLAFRTHKIRWMANSLKLSGIGHYYKSELHLCLEDFKKSVSLFNSIKRNLDAALVLNNMAAVYRLKGNFIASILNYQKAEKIFKELNEKDKLLTIQFNIGAVYLEMEDYRKALNYTQNALTGFLEINDEIKIVNALNNIGNIYYFKNEYATALDFFGQSLSRAKKTGNKQLIGNAYLSLAEVYYHQGEIPLSHENVSLAIKNYEDINFKGEIIKCNILLGEIYYQENKINDAISKLEYALNEAQKSLEVKSIEEAAFELYKCYKSKRMAEQSLAYFELSKRFNDSIKNLEKTKSFYKNAISYEFEKKALADSITNAEHIKVKEAEIDREKALKQRNRTVIYGLGLVVVIIIGFSFYLYNRVIVIRRQKNIIDIQKLKVDNAYHKLEIEKQLVESKNKEIMSSISYAKRIQDTLLPKEGKMNDFFKNFLLFYKPKDIVSGDFYFFKTFKDIAVIATVDCTGHGVPGGFMSMMGSLLLDKIIQHNKLNPAEILLHLNNDIVRILDQKDGGEIQDGMDLSICVINKNTKEMSFSGARNGILIDHNGKLERYEANLIPVGGTFSKKSIEMEREYTNHQIKIKENSWVYMYSDGFQDQLSGTKMTSLGINKFEEILQETSVRRNEKTKFLEDEFDEWKGEFPQIDDLLIIGFQV